MLLVFLKVLLIIFVLGYFSTPHPSHALDQNLVLNEIMAKPDDETEWVEIYNPTDQTIDLIDWQIKDGNSLSADDLSLNGQIGPLEFKVFEHIKGWLNDSGPETVTLLNGTTTIDSYSYDGASQGKTFGRQPDGDSWEGNLTPTKGSSNGNPPTPTPTETPTPEPTSTPTLTPTSSPTPTKTPTPTKAPTPTKTPTPTKSTAKTSPSPSKTKEDNSPPNLPASILGTSSISTTPPSSSNSPTTSLTLNNLFINGGILILILSGVLMFTFIRKNKFKFWV